MSRHRGDPELTWSETPSLWYDFSPARGGVEKSTDREESVSVPPSRASGTDPALHLGVAVATLFFVSAFIDIGQGGPAEILLFGLLAAAGTFTAFLRPRWFPGVVVAYFPFSMQYPFAIGGGVNMLNLLLLLGPVAIVSYREQARRRYPFGAFEYLLVVFIILGFVGMGQAYQQSGDFLESLTQYKRWSTPALFFFIIRALLHDRNDIARMVKVMAWTTTAAGVLTWWSAIQRGPRSSIEASRVSGIFNGPNEMGTFLVYASMTMLAIVVWRTTTGKKLLYLSGFLIAARAMLFTFSRGAYVSLAAGSTVILLLRNPFYLVGVAVLGSGAVIVDPGLIPDSVVTRLAQTTHETAGEGGVDEGNLDKSVSHRFVLWRAAGLIIRDHPLAGVGLGRFPYYVDAYAERPLKEQEARDVHNAYLLVATELGIPALLVMVALLATLLATCLRLYLRRRHPFDRMVALGVLGSVVALSCTFMLGSRFSDENYISYFWTLASFVMVLRRFRDVPQHHPISESAR